MSNKDDWEEPVGLNLGDMVDTAGYIVRGITMLILTLLLVLGAYYALKVFVRIGGVATQPAEIEEQVIAINNIIEGEQLNFGNPQQPIRVGRTISMVILGIIYLVWAWIPLLIIATTGRVLLQGLNQRRENEQAIERASQQIVCEANKRAASKQ